MRELESPATSRSKLLSRRKGMYRHDLDVAQKGHHCQHLVRSCDPSLTGMM